MTQIPHFYYQGDQIITQVETGEGGGRTLQIVRSAAAPGWIILQDRVTGSAGERTYALTDAAGSVTTLLTKQANVWTPHRRFIYDALGRAMAFAPAAPGSQPFAVQAGEWNYFYCGGYLRTGTAGFDEIYRSGTAAYDPYTGAAPVHDPLFPAAITIPSVQDWWNVKRLATDLLNEGSRAVNQLSSWFNDQASNADNFVTQWASFAAATVIDWQGTVARGMLDAVVDYATDPYNWVLPGLGTVRNIVRGIGDSYDRYTQLGIHPFTATILQLHPMVGMAEGFEGVSYQGADFGRRLDAFERWERGIQSAVDTASVVAGGLGLVRGLIAKASFVRRTCSALLQECPVTPFRCTDPAKAGLDQSPDHGSRAGPTR